MAWDEIKPQLRGPVALALPAYNPDLSLNLDGFRRNIAYMVRGGIGHGRGFLISPSGTGEYVTLSPEEHRQIVQAAVEAAGGAFPVVAGIGTCDLRVAIDLGRASLDAGAACVMLTPPFYYALNDNTYVEWVEAIAAKVPAPIMIYSQPWRAGMGTAVTLPQLDKLAKIPQVVSIKYGSPQQYHEMITALHRHADRLAFIDNSLGFTFTVGHMHGSSGYIAGPAAWWPDFELTYWDLLEAGRYREAELHHARIAPYMNFFMGDEFPGSDYPKFFGASVIKASYEYVGLYGGPVRPPFHALTQDQEQELFRILSEVGARRNAAERVAV